MSIIEIIGYALFGAGAGVAISFAIVLLVACWKGRNR